MDALDHLEECRSLTRAESTLRRLAAQEIHNLKVEKLSFWRQRFNLRRAVEWDENSRFFHTSANGRRRKNAIQRLEHDGDKLTSHDAKSVVLFDFYNDLLGTAVDMCCRFSLHDLYPISSVLTDKLSRDFTEDEITDALFAMDRNASPGPDGFGPSFYRAFWPQLKPLVSSLFSDFQAGALDLDGLNRAHLILLPKREGICSADGFRPISLQNCPMKLFSKAMANRLKKVIPSLIAADQTSFVQGRNIAENFVYAAHLLSCCYKRKAPTAILKLDFKKAFDSVSWDSLDKILAARGFDERWRLWFMNILTSGKTAVMLNGVPGRWINCKRDLPQGDPISPYLFIIVADVLQHLIHDPSRSHLLTHPIDQSLPAPTLQYTDDTLILVKGSVDAMVALKEVLECFSLATGLTINFHKSTFVPLHIHPDVAARMARAVGCPIAEFPQTYLGLPLSPHKLRVCDYQPLGAKFDKYLSGWKARLLSTGGWLVLVNAVLSNLATYFMSSMLLPKTIIEALEARRRSFLWTGEEKCHGSRCLLAWEKLCRENEYGGLGVRPKVRAQTS